MSDDRDETESPILRGRHALNSGDNDLVLAIVADRATEENVEIRGEMRRLAAMAMVRIGMLLEARSELEQAELDLAKPEHHWAALSVRVTAATVNLHRGSAHDALATAIDAIVQLAEAQDSVFVDEVIHIATIRTNVALLFLSLGVPEIAIDLLDQALLDVPAGMPMSAPRLNLANAHLMIARRRRADRDPDWNLSASRCLAAVVSMTEKERLPRRLIEGATLTASVHLLFREVDAAGRVLVASLEHCSEVLDPTALAQHHSLLAVVLGRSGQLDDSYEWAALATSYADSIFDRAAAAPIYRVMAKAASALGHHEQAAENYAAADEVSKSNIKHVHALVIQLVAQTQLSIEHRRLLRAQHRLADQVRVDPLTGVQNRYALDLMLAESGAQTDDISTVAVLFLDIDQFKLVNDSNDHATGDEVLRRLAVLVPNALRADDQFFRYGGDEFVAILPSITGQAAHVTAERIRVSIESDRSAATPITVSIGCSIGRSNDLSRILAGADEAMYVAKRSGRNRVAFAGPKSSP